MALSTLKTINLPWRRAKVTASAAPARVPEINILPPKYQKAEIRPAIRKLRLMLLMFGFLAAAQLMGRTDAISDGFTRIRENLAGAEDPSIEQERLIRVQVNNAQTKLDIKAQALLALSTRQVDWGAVFGEMQFRSPEGLTLSSVIQNPSRHDELDILGVATATNLITEYRQNLIASDMFSGVAVRSIRGRSEGATEFTFTIFLSEKSKTGVKQ